jgi:hypothetical protein
MPTAHNVGGLNLPAAIGLAVMIAVFAASLVVGGHSTPPDAEPPEDDGGGGGNGPPSPPDPPGHRPGGVPLDDAEPAAWRLRGPRAPIRSRPRPRRRETREPSRPRRTPAR